MRKACTYLTEREKERHEGCEAERVSQDHQIDTYNKLAYALDATSVFSFFGACGLMLIISAVANSRPSDVRSGRGEMTEVEANRLDEVSV